MNHLNNDNIDEIMFQLLEGEIQGAERTKLLDAINADKQYAAIWATWQKTVLNANDELLVMNTNKLKKKTNKPFLLWAKYAAAACVVLSIGILFFNQYKNEDSSRLTDLDKKGNPKANVIKMPEKPTQNTLVKDTFVPLKEKIKWMANNIKSNQDEVIKLNIPKVKNEIIVKENKIEKPDLLVEKPEIPNQEIPKAVKQKDRQEEKPVFAQNSSDNNILVSYETESIKTKKQNILQEKVTEKTNLLARIFSKPKLQIVNDSNTRTNRKLILQNKEYKIIAGF